MKQLLEDLFPIYRTLCGPGALQTLQRIQRELPGLAIHEYRSGTDVCGWTIPKEFVVKNAFVKDLEDDGVLHFEQHPYRLWIYSQPFSGVISANELREHLTIGTHGVPLRQTYYKPDWGFCAEPGFELTEREYRVHIDVEHRDGFLRIGEYYLPGETSQEILVNSYTCHPLGANDNCSGMVACVELFKRLAALPKRRYSYRLCLWPETIGPITWIAKKIEETRIVGRYGPMTPQGIHGVLCALTIAICGDKSGLKYDASLDGDSVLDDALWHVFESLPVERQKDAYVEMMNDGRTGLPFQRSYSGFVGPTDSRHFNGMGVNIPAVTLTRGGPCNYPEYHSSADTPEIIDWDNMEETVDVAFKALQVIERNRVFKPNYITTPCLQKHGIFPYQHGTGNGESTRTDQARAYFELMYLADGWRDLLSIADSQGMSIFDFDEPVEKFLAAGLISEV